MTPQPSGTRTPRHARKIPPTGPGGATPPSGGGRRRAAGALPDGTNRTGAAPSGSSAAPAGTKALAAAMSEDRGPDSLDAHVRKLMKDLGLTLAYHTKDSRRSPSGFPDWTITGTRTIFRELKREGKNPTPAQQAWLDGLTAAGDDADVWRPSDLLSGRIASELVAISGLRVAGGAA